MSDTFITDPGPGEPSLVERLRAELASATAECERLRAENAQLRKHLASVCDRADEYVGMGWDFNDESEQLTAAIDAARKECLPKNSPT